MDAEIRKRLKWVEMYDSCKNAGLVCLRCGISRPTLRKWLKRYAQHGIEGLSALSHKPHRMPNRKVNEGERERILQLRESRFGARRIQGEVRLYEGISFSLSTIHKVLKAANAKPLVKIKRSSLIKRYSRSVPGDRVQMDTMKVAPGVYQYTAIDDCSRFRVLGVYPRRDAASTYFKVS